MAGREILAKRHQLRAFAMVPVEPVGLASMNNHSSMYRVTNEYHVTSEYAAPPLSVVDGLSVPSASKTSDSSDTCSNPKSYSVNISSARPPLSQKQNSHQRKHKATIEANRAAFGYAKVASLFFVSLLVTWVPSSLNRVYSIVHPGSVSVQLAYAGGVVLSLMGFWNAVIYIATSHRACRLLFQGIFNRRSERMSSRDVAEIGSRRSRVRSDGDSLEGLAGEPESV